jgi:DNA helicase-2/ATP-dependent DNA helicase PcrA
MPAHPDYQAEYAYLDVVLSFLRGYHAEISGQKKEIDARVAYSLKHYNSDNPEQFTELTYNLYHQESFDKKETEARRALNKPYFARVDFTPDALGDAGRYYIGKMTLMRELEMLIIDWRAPVAALYYEGRLGRAAYDCPDGEISGEITLKRQYAIEGGQLTDITDIDITANDAFLQAALSVSKDRRLKDIVTTIQAEQNRVIRAPLYAPLIVQGAAGSGKTTIALHRIAYLLYAYEKQLSARHAMIMAPNRFFLSYISDVLPDLGVDRVRQTTFEDFAVTCVGFDTQKTLHINPVTQILADRINKMDAASAEAMEAAHLKSGVRYIKLIRRFCRWVEKHSFPREDFLLEGYELYTHEALAELFLREYSYLPVARRAAEIHKHLSNTLRKEKPLILQSIDSQYDHRREHIKRLMPEDTRERRAAITELLGERDEKMRRVRSKSSVVIRQYMRAYALNPVLKQYESIFTKPGFLDSLAKGIFTPEECALLTRRAAAMLASRKLDAEDLPPLMYIQIKLFGLEDPVDTKHIVIDEAQDFSLFQFYVLKEAAPNASFSILGDIHQGIFAYKSARDWEAVRKFIFPKSAPAMSLEQSYRTTVEIMEAANRIVTHLYPAGGDFAVPLAKPVIRHGPAVELHTADDIAAAARAADKKITACQKDGHQSIALICKTIAECGSFCKKLKHKAALITGRENEYTGGLLLLPAYLAKGLEFDAVIIVNASEESYRVEPTDIKLLYIAMTRALHQLILFSVGPASPLLKGMPLTLV